MFVGLPRDDLGRPLSKALRLAAAVCFCLLSFGASSTNVSATPAEASTSTEKHGGWTVQRAGNVEGLEEGRISLARFTKMMTSGVHMEVGTRTQQSFVFALFYTINYKLFTMNFSCVVACLKFAYFLQFTYRMRCLHSQHLPFVSRWKLLKNKNKNFTMWLCSVVRTIHRVCVDRDHSSCALPPDTI